MSYKLAINNIKEIIEEAIRFYSNEDYTLSFTQFKCLLKCIRGESSNASINYPMQTWKALNKSLNFNIPSNYVHDFLIIIFGSIAFSIESAALFLVKHLKRYGLSSVKAKQVIKESREYFKDRIAYIPIGHYKELTLNTLHTEQAQYSFKPEIHPLKKGLYSDKTNRSKNKATITNEHIKEKHLTPNLPKSRKVKFKLRDTEISYSPKHTPSSTSRTRKEHPAEQKRRDCLVETDRKLRRKDKN